MKIIELEDIITLVCTEFVKKNQSLLKPHYKAWDPRIPYLRLSTKARRKISEKLINHLEETGLIKTLIKEQ